MFVTLPILHPPTYFLTFASIIQSGIAIIEISLLHNRSRNTITVSDKRSVGPRSIITKSDILLKRMEEDELSLSYQIVVDITNTTVDIDVLHRVSWSVLEFLISMLIFIFSFAHCKILCIRSPFKKVGWAVAESISIDLGHWDSDPTYTSSITKISWF